MQDTLASAVSDVVHELFRQADGTLDCNGRQADETYVIHHVRPRGLFVPLLFLCLGPGTDHIIHADISKRT